MDVLQKEVYEATPPVSRIAAKASVKKLSHPPSPAPSSSLDPPSREFYEGCYVVEPWSSTSRGTYGGDLICQGLNAAWQSVINRAAPTSNKTNNSNGSSNDGASFQPHSLHAYFVRAGSTESVMRWEVLKVSDSRNFANRCVLGYQSHNNSLVVTLQVSFTKDNCQIAKQRQFEQQVASGTMPKSWPVVFKRHPGPMFYQYRDNLHRLDIRTRYYGGHLTHGIPQEYYEPSDDFNLATTGDQERGFFVKINDDLGARIPNKDERDGGYGSNANGGGVGTDAGAPSATELIRRKYLALAYASDAFWAATWIKALGLPMGTTTAANVSLDHTLYFHDSNFELGRATKSTDDSNDNSNNSSNSDNNWLYLETQFVSMGNNRVLAIVNFYTLANDGKLIATVVQEMYGFVPKDVADKSRQLHDKVDNKGKLKSGVDAKL
ncbi:Thioesterase-like family protein [Candida parapsilosis]|uniref:Uncharacterized protein n=2 Tax=Candida parapsilosis TaxID=5480 RepID=G8BE73_CANPC|nr:uncharacterized protein CPAR2_212140 [Candida parapsilosis]KAF6054281.1 Thioesterase-like family protein [Candida parapsilosis]KAF6056695.1 Thioesterase-like family protein [Candida parapsilosis]KAF6059630.1 Thioesterase-like family protein [Candida parapsilosis]KAF6068383.1 Thioesterase-like family protein [Candida parapsilosis]KAI5903078.1 hypothetical protein K4G60_g2223 [Candida parapsilosis]